MFSTGAPGGTFDEVVKFADTYTLEVAYLNGRKHISHAYHTHDIPKHIPWINFMEKNIQLMVNHQECFLHVSYETAIFFGGGGYPLINIIELDDGNILTGKPDQFDGKNPWVSG